MTGVRIYVAVLILLAIVAAFQPRNLLSILDSIAWGILRPETPAVRVRLVSTGGSFPKEPKTLAIRWTGYSNFELAYNGQVILLDAYFDRGSMFPPLGFKAADVKRAHLMLIGHGKQHPAKARSLT